jgi:hypothetical protein
VLVFGLLASAVDLFLLEHFEDTWQLAPLILIGAGLIVIIWHLLHRISAGVRVMQVTMTLFLIAGLAGLVLHYLGSMEFQLEVNPDLKGFELFSKAVQAKAPPALGPGAMLHLGLLGLAYCYRHPLCGRQAIETKSATGE